VDHQVFADRVNAARLLGVAPSSTPDEVRRAFRLWAAVVHPDHGGNAQQFGALCTARDVLLAPDPSAEAATTSGPSATTSGPPATTARRPWSSVVCKPSAGTVAITAALVAFALMLVPLGAVLPMPWGLAPAAIAATGACVVIGRLLLRHPDHGHVIVTRSGLWGSVTALQCLLAWGLGIAVIEALPLLALPFVAAIALVNPGAGLRVVNVR